MRKQMSGLERWLGGWEHVLLLKRTRATSGRSQLTVPPTPGGTRCLCPLCTCTHMCKCLHNTIHTNNKKIENKCDLNFSLLGQAISSADILEVKSYSCRPEAPSPKFGHLRKHLVRESISKVRFRMWSVSAFVQLQRKEATFSWW